MASISFHPPALFPPCPFLSTSLIPVFGGICVFSWTCVPFFLTPWCLREGETVQLSAFILHLVVLYALDVSYRFSGRTIAFNVTWCYPEAHQMEPPSPMQALGVNPFSSRFINRTVTKENGSIYKSTWEIDNWKNEDWGSIWWAPGVSANHGKRVFARVTRASHSPRTWLPCVNPRKSAKFQWERIIVDFRSRFGNIIWKEPSHNRIYR